jgi:hypothetical protein
MVEFRHNFICQNTNKSVYLIRNTEQPNIVKIKNKISRILHDSKEDQHDHIEINKIN